MHWPQHMHRALPYTLTHILIVAHPQVYRWSSLQPPPTFWFELIPARSRVCRFGNYSDAHHRLGQFYGPWDLTGSPQHFEATSDTAWGPTINKITMSTTSTGTNIWAHYMEFRKLFQHSLYLGLGFCSCVGTSGCMRVCFKIQLQQKKIRVRHVKVQ